MHTAVLVTRHDQVRSRRHLDAGGAVGGFPLLEQRPALQVVHDEEVGLCQRFVLQRLDREELNHGIHQEDGFS